VADPKILKKGGDGRQFISPVLIYRKYTQRPDFLGTMAPYKFITNLLTFDVGLHAFYTENAAF